MNSNAQELLRYVINGMVASAVHYGVLTFNLEVLNFPSAGLANLAAALFGIITSFLGNSYFVFRKTDEAILLQAMKFLGLYCVLAVLHFLVLLIWTDWLGLDYRIGFLIAIVLQVSLGYIGNKILVFKI